MYKIDRKLDPKIRASVNLLRTAGFNTFASCQGGLGHAFKVPIIRMAVVPNSDIWNLSTTRSKLRKESYKLKNFTQKWKNIKISIKRIYYGSFIEICCSFLPGHEFHGFLQISGNGLLAAGENDDN